MEGYTACDYGSWEAAGLLDFGDFAEKIEYVNQREDGFEVLAGDWFYPHNETRTIYFGTFGNYNSPGADHFTYAEVYDDENEYREAVASWEAMPEYSEEYVAMQEDDEDEDDEGEK